MAAANLADTKITGDPEVVVPLALGEKTIWCQDWQNGRRRVPDLRLGRRSQKRLGLWPTFAEMKWEDDDRTKKSIDKKRKRPVASHN